MSAVRQVAAEALGAQDWRARNHRVITFGLAWLCAALSDYVAELRRGSPEVVNGEEGDRLRSATVPELRTAYEAERAALRASGQPAAIDRISQLFGLTPFDEDCLLLAAAPRLDAAFAGLFAHADNRPHPAAATLHLAIALFAGGEAEASRRAFEHLSPAAPLRRLRLVEVDDSVPSLLTPLETDERIARFIAGEDYLDPRAQHLLAPVPAAPCPAKHRPAAMALADAVREASPPAAVIVGPRNSGRGAVALAVARELELGLGSLRLPLLPERGPGRQAALKLLAREAALGGYALLIDADEAQARDDAVELLRELEACVFVLAREPLEAAAPQLRLTPIEAADRVALWRQLLEPAATALNGACERLAEQFPLGPAAIARIAADNRTPDETALWAACRDAAGQQLDALAERIQPRFDWDDIVVPASIAEDLRAVAAQVRHRAAVYGRGGFGRKLVRGRGVTALFGGPSGTGKTMAAEIIAGDLGLDLWRVDLAGVVSKYIGETEKNLKRVFDAAESGGAVLFFDEADALFGKRSEVKDSHDRYANIEISYLLQRMEAYSGLAVLATNMKGHLDPAFLRRLRFVIDFPFPDSAHRRAIWALSFPPETATEGLDLTALARLEVAGGNITVIAVNAAFLAAAEGKPVGMVHLARAARAEFRKLDKEFRSSWKEAR
jgi:ATPase family associated with various cellular activities (AAA)